MNREKLQGSIEVLAEAINKYSCQTLTREQSTIMGKIYRRYDQMQRLYFQQFEVFYNKVPLL